MKQAMLKLNRSNQVHHRDSLQRQEQLSGAATGGASARMLPHGGGGGGPNTGQARRAAPGGGAPKPRNRASLTSTAVWAPLAQSKRVYPNEKTTRPFIVGFPIARSFRR